MPTANPIAPPSPYPPNEVDPALEALKAFIAAAGTPEFTAESVVVIAPEETDQGIDTKISAAVARSRGVCLLLIGGEAKNPHREAPGPRVTLAVEAQLFVSTRMRAKNATAPLALVAALARRIHHQEIRAGGIPWTERLYFMGWAPLPDPDFTAYALDIEREMQL